MIICYHLYLFTDYVSDIELRYMMGWSIIGVTALNIFFNMTLIIINTVIGIIQLIQKLKIKCREKNQDKVQIYTNDSL